MAHYDIVIATPGSSMVSHYVKSLVLTIKAIEERGLSWTFLSHSASLVNVAREATIEDTKIFDMDNNKPMGGKHTYNKIISIDSDIEWTSEQFLKLYDHDLDVVSGVYLIEDGKQSSIHYKDAPLQMEDFSWRTTPFRCDGFGFGFLAIRTGIFERLSRAWFRSSLHPMINNETGVILTLFSGEDLSWCERVKNELNVDLWCDPNIKVKHHKMNPVMF